MLTYSLIKHINLSFNSSLIIDCFKIIAYIDNFVVLLLIANVF